MRLYTWKIGLKWSEWMAGGTLARIVSGVILAVLAQAGIACSSDTSAVDDPIAQIQFQREWHSDLQPGTSIVDLYGGFTNNGFPALSADESQIAILYHTDHPLDPGFPTVEFYSTKTLTLLERMDLLPEIRQVEAAPDQDSPLFNLAETRIEEINRRLSRGAFRSMQTLFKLPPSYVMRGVESMGKQVDYERIGEGNDFLTTLTITSMQSGEIELTMAMPIIPSIWGSENPDNDCSVMGAPLQGWYEHSLRILVVQLDFNSVRDGCEQPEQWHFKRL